MSALEKISAAVRLPRRFRPLCYCALLLASLPVVTRANAHQPINAEFIRALARAAVRESDVPAMSIVVMNSREIRVKEIAGVLVDGHPEVAQLDHFFHIGSGAKSVLAFAAGRLVEQGIVKWDTRFFEALPQLREAAHPAYADITLEQLLAFRAGIPAYGDWDALYDVSRFSGGSRMGFVRHVLSQAPGSLVTDQGFEALYSNASYTLAAVMLEAVAGRRWEELLHSILTDDLGLQIETGWPVARGNRQPYGHARATDGIYEVWLRNDIRARGSARARRAREPGLRSFAPGDPYALPDEIAPAGEISMTSLDYARYVRLHLAGLRGDPSYLSAGTLRRIHFGHDELSLGVANYELAGEAISSFDGSAGTFFSHVTIAPESDFAFVILTNSGSPAAVDRVHRVAARILKRRFQRWWWFWI